MPLQVGTDFPSLVGATGWLNETGTPEKIGRPTLGQFWAISCPVCKMNMPQLQEFVDTYYEQGLRPYTEHGTSEINLLCDQSQQWHGTGDKGRFNFLMVDGHVANVTASRAHQAWHLSLNLPSH